MVKSLVVKTGNPKTLFDNMHELGASFYCKSGENAYQVVYFARNRQIHFKGSLSADDLKNLQADSVEVKSITVDEFDDEIIIEE